MLLPLAPCPTCRKDVLTVWSIAGDGDDADLALLCADCGARLDRFGVEPERRSAPWEEVVACGYRDLDKPAPVGRGGCFETRGCDGCPKIATRPW